MSKIHYIIDIIGQFLSTNRIAFEETKEVLIFNLRQSFIFFQSSAHVRKLTSFSEILAAYPVKNICLIHD